MNDAGGWTTVYKHCIKDDDASNIKKIGVAESSYDYTIFAKFAD